MTSKLTRTMTIQNVKGLHARASSRFVLTVEKFNAEVTVSKDGSTVGGTSIMGLMMLAATKGSQIEVSAQGDDADAALNAIETLLEDKFDEGE